MILGSSSSTGNAGEKDDGKLLRKVGKHIGLYTKFGVLFAMVAIVLLAVGAVWIRESQERQTEREMLETTRVLAREMDAVWEFMEMNQHQFKLGSDGTYNLYCVVAAKSVSKIFTRDSDYVIHYTNTTTRKPDDAPDDFELAGLEAFKANPSLEYYYGFDEYEGARVFRYMEPVYIGESCLECHGEPAGEIDVKGYPKEGMVVGDIAGAASIIMPTKTFDETLDQNILNESMLLGAVLVGGFAVIFFGISRMVARPLAKMRDAMGCIEKGKFDEGIGLLGVGDGVAQRDEIAELSRRFRSMSCQLKDLYENLSGQVENRTAQLTAANAVLEEQRIVLEETNRKLLEDSDYKSNFLAIMSHELRTPLTSVLAFVDVWLSDYGPRDENERKIAHEILVNSQVMLGIVNNILEMARAEAGKQTLNLDVVDLFDLVPMIKEATSVLADKRQINMTAVVDREMPLIVADEEKIRRILENLISNAIKFTEKGGRVQVRVGYDELDDAVRIVVKDDGRGIAAEDQERIFDSFSQGGSASGHIGGGSGLGLSVVKQLAELHGGHVALTSEVGVGSEFVVTIPARSAEEGDADEDSHR